MSMGWVHTTHIMYHTHPHTKYTPGNSNTQFPNPNSLGKFYNIFVDENKFISISVYLLYICFYSLETGI